MSKRTSDFTFYSNLCLTIPSIFLAPFFGTWGDKLGRKIPAIIPAVGTFLSAVNYAICAAVPNISVSKFLDVDFDYL